MADSLYKVATGATGADKKPVYDVFEGSRKLELPEFQKRGLNIDWINPGQTPTAAGVGGLSKVASGSVGPDGKPIFDVFEGGRKLELPEFQQRGLNMDWINPGQAPASFKSQFLPTTPEPVSDTSSYQNDATKIINDITAGLAKYGITSPDTKMRDDIYQKEQSDIQKQRDLLAIRKQEDVAAADKAHAASKDQLKYKQDKDVSDTEEFFRTRTGGDVFQSDKDDLQNLQYQHNMEQNALEGIHEQSLQQARRLYEDGDYAESKLTLQSAKDTQDRIDKSRQDYFQNVLRYQDMQKKIVDASREEQEYVMSVMEKYPSGFTDLSNSALVSLTKSEVNQRILDSKEYSQEQAKQNQIDTQIIQLADGRDVVVNKNTGAIIRTIGGGDSPYNPYNPNPNPNPNPKSDPSGRIDQSGKGKKLTVDQILKANETYGIDLPLGSTEGDVNEARYRASQPRDYKDEELRDIVKANTTYEETISGMEKDPTIKNKDRARLIAGEMFGKIKSPKIKANPPTTNPKSGVQGGSFDPFGASSGSGMTDLLTSFLFK